MASSILQVQGQALSGPKSEQAGSSGIIREVAAGFLTSSHVISGKGGKGDGERGQPSAGINRHIVGDERALQERSSESILGPSLVWVAARSSSRSVDRGTGGQGIELRKQRSECRPFGSVIWPVVSGPHMAGFGVTTEG